MSLTVEQIKSYKLWHKDNEFVVALCDMAVKSLTERTDQRPDVGVAGVLAAVQPMSGHPTRAEEIAQRIRFDYAISMGAKEAIKQAILKACAEQKEADAKIAEKSEWIAAAIRSAE